MHVPVQKETIVPYSITCMIPMAPNQTYDTINIRENPVLKI